MTYEIGVQASSEPLMVFHEITAKHPRSYLRDGEIGQARQSTEPRNFFGFSGNLQRRWPLRPWDELDDPLSSFVPDFRTPPSAGFFLAATATATRFKPAGPDQPGSSRMAGVEGGWCLQPVVFGHKVRCRASGLAAPAETLLGDVILARPAFLAALTYSCLLANALSHSLVPRGRCRTAPSIPRPYDGS